MIPKIRDFRTTTQGAERPSSAVGWGSSRDSAESVGQQFRRRRREIRREHVDERSDGYKLEYRDGDSDGLGVFRRCRHAGREVVLRTRNGVKQRNPPLGSDDIENVVGQDTEPHPLEVPTVVHRIGQEDEQHRQVVERLAVFAKGSIHVREQRPEDHRKEHLGDSRKRRRVTGRVEDVTQPDTQQDRVQNVTALVHPGDPTTRRPKGLPTATGRPPAGR